ncbi:MAG: hypothetical protein IJ957_08910, partial [Rikenellaceae bacterium]|nr:hypothetical protein [Rikenellaceae bacterium]
TIVLRKIMERLVIMESESDREKVNSRAFGRRGNMVALMVLIGITNKKSQERQRPRLQRGIL